MNDISFSKYRRPSRFYRTVHVINTWMVDVGVWLIALMLVYALVGMSS